MHIEDRNARRAAAAIALAAWIGLGLQVATSLAGTGSVVLTLWVLSRYFTILANLVAAVVFTAVAAGQPPIGSPRVMGGLTLAIVLVGVVYNLLLRNGDLRGLASVADMIVHCAMPVLVPLFWLAFVPKGRLGRRDPWIWAAFPLVYLLYAMLRGAIERVYAYPFIDVARIGWPRAGFNVTAIAAGFVIGSFAVVALDGLLARRTGLR